jgi:Glyoxalase/Bleomycin resistance protein/Dioxygenase superfamily
MQAIDVLAFSHIGFAVTSIDEFRAGWGALLGIDDWLIREVGQPAGRVQLHGQPTTEPTITRVAFAKFKGTSLELIEPRGGPTGGADWLARHGPGMQHIGVWVRDLPTELERLDGLVEVTYSPATLRPEMAGRPVAATTSTTATTAAADPALRPPFWAFVEPVAAGAAWSLELLDAKFAADYRAYYGDHPFYPGDLPGTETL